MSFSRWARGTVDGLRELADPSGAFIESNKEDTFGGKGRLGPYWAGDESSYRLGKVTGRVAGVATHLATGGYSLVASALFPVYRKTVKKK